MLTKDAACRAKSALDESWLFDKFIKVDWASSVQCNLLNSNKPPLAQVFRRRNDMANSNRQRYERRGPVPHGRDIDNPGDVDDIQVIIPDIVYTATVYSTEYCLFFSAVVKVFSIFLFEGEEIFGLSRIVVIPQFQLANSLFLGTACLLCD